MRCRLFLGKSNLYFLLMSMPSQKCGERQMVRGKETMGHNTRASVRHGYLMICKHHHLLQGTAPCTSTHGQLCLPLNHLNASLLLLLKKTEWNGMEVYH